MMHALVIDDNSQNMRVIAQLLAKSGVSCTEILDPHGLEAELSSIPSVDVIFLDLEMPGLNGYVVKDALRAWFGATPIIAYTVHVSEMNTVQAAGFDGFLGKPLDMSRFPDQLARILNGEQVWERM